MLKLKKGMSALVVGLGRSGVSATKLLVKKGFHVTATDMRTKTELGELFEEIEGLDCRLELGKHILKSFSDPDFIVVSPGISLDIKPLVQAVKSKVPIISEVELASHFITEPMIAITGTNGKTTTACLLGEIFKQAERPVFVGGNTGTPLSEYVLARHDPNTWLVVEVSSFQLESCQQFRPHVAVFLNIAPDHLDRHPSFEAYVQAKMKLHANMTPDDFIVANLRDPQLMSHLSRVPSKAFYFTTDARKNIPVAFSEKFQGCYFDSQGIHLETVRWKSGSFSVAPSKLAGLHNRENMMAALLAAKLAGINNEAIQRAFLSFKPLPHRMEYVARKNQVTFYNNSKGTNVHALLRSLEVFPEPVILIAGGKDKGEDYSTLVPVIKRRVKNLILVGETKEKMNRSVGDYSETFLVGTFEEAVYLAYQKSRSGDVVLLSPGCASQDMFRDYEHRGDYFKELISRF